MTKVYMFKPDGKVLLGTMKEGTTVVCKENMKSIISCSKKELNLVPTDVLRFCKETKQKYLYMNGNGDWETLK